MNILAALNIIFLFLYKYLIYNNLVLKIKYSCRFVSTIY